MSRKQEILEALARELESNPGNRITTARLAASLGVSEAALYRHFPSKARMFEGLIDFAEEGIFSRINQILEEDRQTRQRCARILYLLLAFAERNPGLVRVLLGDALTGCRGQDAPVPENPLPGAAALGLGRGVADPRFGTFRHRLKFPGSLLAQHFLAEAVADLFRRFRFAPGIAGHLFFAGHVHEDDLGFVGFGPQA